MSTTRNIMHFWFWGKPSLNTKKTIMTLSLFFGNKYSISTVIGGYTGWNTHCRCEVRTDRLFNKAKFFIIARSLVSLLTEATAADYKSPKHTYLLKTRTITLVDTNHRSELSHWRSLWCKRSKKVQFLRFL